MSRRISYGSRRGNSEAIGSTPDSEMLLRPKQIKALLEKGGLRRGDERLRAGGRHAHRESLRDDGVTERIGADERRRRCTGEPLERPHGAGEFVGNDEAGGKR